VTQAAPPIARRLRPPTWHDRRLLAGVVLVLASVVLGATVIGRADTSSPVLAAKHTLLPGQRLTGDDLQVVRVRLADVSGRYLPAGEELRPGDVVIRVVLSGELVPRSAVGGPDSVSSRPVAVPVSAAAVEGLRPGALVDVWIAAKGTDPGTYEAPTSVARNAEVVAVSARGGVLSSSGEATVRLLLSQELVGSVLAAVDNQDRVNVVPVPGSVPRGGS
jgi:hypothetical protein